MNESTIENKRPQKVQAILFVLLLGFALGVTLSIEIGEKYNQIVLKDQAAEKSWAEIQNAYERRFDLIPNLVNTVKGAANFEQSTLIAVTQARASVGEVKLDPNKIPTNTDNLEKFQKAQANLSSAISHLLIVVERYPELKANQNFVHLQSELVNTENKISTERGIFNEAVREYNSMIATHPHLILAKCAGYTPRPYFHAVPEAEKSPKVQF